MKQAHLVLIAALAACTPASAETPAPVAPAAQGVDPAATQAAIGKQISRNATQFAK